MSMPGGASGVSSDAQYGISPNPAASDTVGSLLGRTQEAIEAQLKKQYLPDGTSVWALGSESPLTVANKVLSTIFKAILGAFDPHNLPAPEQVWQDVVKTFLAPINWLANIPVGVLSSSTPNLLAPFASDDSLAGQNIWVFDTTVKPSGTTGSVRVTANGTLLELLSERIALDVGQTLHTSVQAYTDALIAAAGSNPVRLSWSGYSGDTEVASGDFDLTQPAADVWTTKSGTLTRGTDDPWDSISMRLVVTADATAGTVRFAKPSATKPNSMPQNLIQGLEADLAAAGQTIRDAICNALGMPGTGHTDADVIHALLNIPAEAVEGMTSLVDQVGDGFKAIFNGWFGHGGTGTAAQVQQTVEAIKIAVTGGYTLETFPTANPAWMIPPGIITTDVIAMSVNAGGNGYNGSGANGGGVAFGGAFVSKVLDLTGLTPGVDTLNISPGVIGANRGDSGGSSTITASTGTLLDGAEGLGGIVKVDGLYATTGSGGNGGAGGTATSSSQAGSGSAGGSSGVANGGAGGTGVVGSGAGTAYGHDGADGAAGITDNTPLVGGSGGGGGGAGATGTALVQSKGGNGGAGGYPGGAGGSGGGQINAGNTAGAGTGNWGANGIIGLLYKVVPTS